MNGPRINNDERGITLNKTLATLALLVSIVPAVVIYTRVSQDFALVQKSVNELKEGQKAQIAGREADRREFETRLRALEQAQVGSERDFAALLDLLRRQDERLERIEQRLEGIFRNGANP